MRNFTQLCLQHALGLAVVFALTICAAATKDPRKTPDRPKSQLPEVFDFDLFKKTYDKRYKSAIEGQIRQKIFLARTIEALATSLSYDNGKANSYLKADQLSDWTQAKVDRSKVSFLNMVNATSSKKTGGFPAGRPVEKYKDIANMPLKARPDLNSLVSMMLLESKTSLNDALNNEPLGLINSEEPLSANQIAPDASKMQNFTGDKFIGATLNHSIEKNNLTLDRTLDLSTVPQINISQIELAEVDHRKSGCFFQPRNQGDCGSCYAFAAVAAYEWLYCQRLNGEKVAFSEQFILDCGQKYDLNGCSGGNIAKTVEFVEEVGLELGANYPYRGWNYMCPYEDSADSSALGFTKVSEAEAKLVKLEVLHQFINHSPIVVVLKLNEHFRQYGGGIDENTGCSADVAHAMLLVGSGREDGNEFYLLRNSYSVSWGELGYYRISKRAFYECSFYGYGVIVEGSPGRVSLDEMRPGYDYEPIIQRYREVLANLVNYSLEYRDV